MKKLTITIDEKLARWVRVSAVEQDMSMSRFIVDLLHRQMMNAQEYESAMKSNLAREPVSISSKNPYPKRSEIHDR